MSESQQCHYSGKNAWVKQELELQRASPHAWSRTEGEQSGASSSRNFLRKKWLDREQELITVIQEETKRTEEKEEAGYRSTNMVNTTCTKDKHSQET